MRALLSGLLLFCTVGLFAQNFDDYFSQRTLRIDYLHIGNKHQEAVEISAYKTREGWTGTRQFLIEPNRYGDVLFEAFDSLTMVPIYSRSYSCLFNEYRTTVEGETIVDTFEECINMPMPKQTILYRFSSFDRYKKKTQLYEGYFNPKHELMSSTPSKPYQVMDLKVMNLHIGGKAEDCLDILFIPDGYSKDDKELMESDMRRFSSYIMNCSPYKELAEHVNIRAIKGYSEEPGITNPNTNTYRKTLLNSSFNTINLDRYLMCLHVWKLNDIADFAPHDVIVIIANTAKYGGGGIFNFYCTVNNIGTHSDYVIVHELGHLLGGLADEYYTSEVSVRDYYPEGVEPVEPNLTTLVDFDNKWKKLVSSDTPIPTPATPAYRETTGVFEGGGYVAKGVFRPCQKCTMKDLLYNHFCPVCKQTLIEVIKYYTND